MDRTSILAHRGLFSDESEKNSPASLKRAIDEGFGIETDIRDLNGDIVISHDPPIASSLLPNFHWLLDLISSATSNGRIALNIKSDGLAELVKSQIQTRDVDLNRFFAFDMSIPDSISYFCTGIPLYSRISDYEPEPAFLDKVKGIWVDNFKGFFPQVKHAKNLIDQGIRATIVSPELHRRNHSGLWNEILESGLYLSPLFELCTDFPVEAANQFCQD